MPLAPTNIHGTIENIPDVTVQRAQEQRTIEEEPAGAPTQAVPIAHSLAMSPQAKEE